jgi:excisionase family DNA binding protein
VRQEIDPDAGYTAAEAAALTGLTVRVVRDAIRAGSLPAAREGRAYRVAGTDLAAWHGGATRRRRAPTGRRSTPTPPTP